MRKGTIILTAVPPSFLQTDTNRRRHFPVCNVHQTAMPTLNFSNAAPVGNSDICLNGKRLTADDLFSLTGNSILKTRSSLLFFIL